MLLKSRVIAFSIGLLCVLLRPLQLDGQKMKSRIGFEGVIGYNMSFFEHRDFMEDVYVLTNTEVFIKSVKTGLRWDHGYFVSGILNYAVIENRLDILFRIRLLQKFVHQDYWIDSAKMPLGDDFRIMDETSSSKASTGLSLGVGYRIGKFRIQFFADFLTLDVFQLNYSLRQKIVERYEQRKFNWFDPSPELRLSYNLERASFSLGYSVEKQFTLGVGYCF